MNQSKEEKKLYQRCRKCNLIVPKKLRVCHCKICDICVMDYDHHCPWTGKCIAEYNKPFFYVFIFSLLVYIFAIFVCFLTFIIYMQDELDKKHKK